MALTCAAAKNLPIDETGEWELSSATASIFEWAGWPDDPNPAKARRAFLSYDNSADQVRASYKLPFARVVDGVLTAFRSGVDAAAARLDTTPIPPDIQDEARAILEEYRSKSTTPAKRESTSVKLETRDCLVRRDDRVLLRALDPLDQTPGFDGYITTWNTVDDRGTFFTPGSATKTIKERSLSRPVLWQHDSWTPIGKHTEVEQDDTGVKIRAAISATELGSDCMTLLRDEVPMGLSFGFIRMRDRSATDDDKLDLSVAPDYIQSLPRKELRAVTEWAHEESSVVTFPANEKAGATQVRSTAGQDLATAEQLAMMVAAIREGSLSEELLTRCREIVAAIEERAALEESTRQAMPRRSISIEIESLFADLELGSAA